MCTLKPSKSGIMSNIFVRFCGPLLTMLPHPLKKFISGGYGPLTPPLHRRLCLEIGEGILWNLLPSEIKVSETKAIFGRKLANRQANC